MSRKNALGPLIDLLVEIYPTEEGSRRVVAEAGLHHGRIPFQDAAIDNWFAILSEADRSNSVAAVVTVAQAEYPEFDSQLTTALDHYVSSPEDSEQNTPDSEHSDPDPSEDPPDDPLDSGDPAPGAYRRNLAMLMILTFVVPVWFYLHVYPLMERSLAVGALGAGLAAGLLAAWKLTASFIGKTWRSKSRSRVDRLLRSPRVSWVLAVVSVLVLGLAGSISSVYWVHDDKALKELTLMIQEADGDSLKPFAPLPRLRTRPSDSLAGGPVFFRWPGETLVLTVESSPILEIRQNRRRLWPWKRLELRASVDLQSRPVKVFRVAPGNVLMGRLAEPGEFVPFKAYALEVLWNGESAGLLDDVRQGVVFFGDDPKVMDALRAAETPEQKRRALKKCASTENLDELMEYWDSDVQFVETKRPSGPSELEIRLVDPSPAPSEASNGELSPTPVIVSRVVVPAESISSHGIHTICLQGAFP